MRLSVLATGAPAHLPACLHQHFLLPAPLPTCQSFPLTVVLTVSLFVTYVSASLPASVAMLGSSLCAALSHPVRLTAIVVQGGELGSLVAAASAVAGPHAQLVPRGLSQFGQKHLGGAVGPQALPGPGAPGPVLQHDGRDGAAPVVPALQVKPSMGGVDMGEEVLVFAEGGLWGARGRDGG